MKNLGRFFLTLAVTIWLGPVLIAAPVPTRFSFSGTQWGDSVDTVQERLRTSGLAFESKLEVTTCQLRSRCSVKFSGQLTGDAVFADKGLVEIMIYTSGTAGLERLDKLIEKYGQPLPSKPNAKTPGSFGSTDLTKHWVSADGESLFYDGGYIRYSSAIANAERRARNREVSF